MSIQRFMLVGDDDCRTYCIPVEKQDEFETWVSEESCNGGSEPDWAQPLDDISGFTFTDPEF